MKTRELYKTAKNSVGPVEVAVFLAVIAISAAGTYALLSDEDTQQNPAVEIDRELNSSHDSMNIDFFNETLEISMEQGSQTRFYLDLQADGNADMQLTNLTRDGRIRSSTKILDYPSGVYHFHYSYHVGQGEEHWLKIDKVEKLG